MGNNQPKIIVSPKCSTNCSNLTVVDNLSEWLTGAFYRYQYANCKCDSCGRTMRAERCEFFTASPFKEYIVDECKHPFLYVDLKSANIKYCTEVNGKVVSDDAALQAEYYVRQHNGKYKLNEIATTIAKCEACCGKILVKADCKYKENNREKKITSSWKIAN